MAIQQINIGAAPNDKTGDKARDWAQKTNANFTNPDHAASRIMATNAQALAGTPGVIPDAAGVKSYVDQFGVGGPRDLRSTIYSTGVPSDLYGKGTVFGFADAAELGIAGYPVDSYGALEVGYHWTDGTGLATAYRRFTTGTTGLPIEFLQAAISSAAWGPWKKTIAEGDSITVTSADKWTTGRTFSFTGGATGTSSAVDGSANVSIALTVSNSGHTHTAAQIGAATAGLAVGAIGSYILAGVATTTAIPGDTIAGSSLRPIGLRGSGLGGFNAAYNTAGYGSGLSGTWRCMGYCDESSSNSTLWLRIS